MSEVANGGISLPTYQVNIKSCVPVEGREALDNHLAYLEAVADSLLCSNFTPQIQGDVRRTIDGIRALSTAVLVDSPVSFRAAEEARTVLGASPPPIPQDQTREG
jgi:hypothetical protein